MKRIAACLGLQLRYSNILHRCCLACSHQPFAVLFSEKLCIGFCCHVALKEAAGERVFPLSTAATIRNVGCTGSFDDAVRKLQRCFMVMYFLLALWGLTSCKVCEFPSPIPPGEECQRKCGSVSKNFGRKCLKCGECYWTALLLTLL